MSNPVLSEKQWGDIADREGGLADANAMTVNGTIMKTGLLLVIMLAVMWWLFDTFWNNGEPDMAKVQPFMFGGMIAGLVLALITMFAKRLAMFTGILYAAAQGLFVGGFTMYMESIYPGLPLLAAAFTTGTLLGMLFLYRAGVIKATSGFMKGVMGAVAGLMLGIGILFVLNLFGIGYGITGMLYGNGPIGIGFSILCITLAALSLVVDFKVIEDGASNRAPKWMEWLGAFGLMVTLVWLYIEILRLLAKLRASDD
ncbi:MAG: Bax inhibitor-1/YccA family protein [Planctomycetes bacterium]|nr:Bax inhibitor-1/YccA family protein [Planctomycetota bacterium]